jgi:SRSO17 transposase
MGCATSCVLPPLPHLGNQSAMVVIDETSFPKQGKHSAGVGVQYCGPTGQVENWQVGVFLASVTARGHTPTSRELYLPLDWTEDRERCQAAGIDIRRFASRRNRN